MRRRGRLQHEQDTEEGMLHGFRVIYEHTGNGWSAYAPDLPGLGGGAASREEMERLMDEAIPLHLDALKRDRAERPWLYKAEDL